MHFSVCRTRVAPLFHYEDYDCRHDQHILYYIEHFFWGGGPYCQ